MALSGVNRLIPHGSVCCLSYAKTQFVGLLTYAFRVFPQRLYPAFSGIHPMTCFHRKNTDIRTDSTAA